MSEVVNIARRGALRAIGTGGLGLAGAISKLAKAGFPEPSLVGRLAAPHPEIASAGFGLLRGPTLRLLRRKVKFQRMSGDDWRLDADLAELKSVSTPVKLLIQRHRVAQMESWFDQLTGEVDRDYDYFD